MEDVKKFQCYSNLFAVFLILTMISVVPLVYCFDLYGAIAAALLFAVTFVLAVKVEKYKKKNNIQTYKEIVAFMNGERLDEISKNRELGKRPYQKILLALGCGAITLIIALLWIWLI